VLLYRFATFGFGPKAEGVGIIVASTQAPALTLVQFTVA